MAAFRTDLGDRFDIVIVVSMSEFCRRAAENAAVGTDHGRGSAMFVRGGAINGGQVIADWQGFRRPICTTATCASLPTTAQCSTKCSPLDPDGLLTTLLFRALPAVADLV